MTNHESDELLRQVIDALGEVRRLLDERLPKPSTVSVETKQASGTLVTGEEAPRPPAKKTQKVTGR